MTEYATGATAGFSGEQQIRIALKKMVSQGGTASTSDLYQAIEQSMNGSLLSEQGKASLRYFINKVAVKAGYVYPADPNQHGWRITPEGREIVADDTPPVMESAVNVDTLQLVELPSNSARGAAFELYVLQMLRALYPHYSWYHQGHHKFHERGLDFIGSQLTRAEREPRFIGVQVKLHASNTAPSQIEWLKFLSGCFARKIDLAIFITSGRLSAEQRREAGEAQVVVIEGREEISRIAKQHGLEEFELFEEVREV